MEVSRSGARFSCGVRRVRRYAAPNVFIDKFTCSPVALPPLATRPNSAKRASAIERASRATADAESPTARSGGTLRRSTRSTRELSSTPREGLAARDDSAAGGGLTAAFEGRALARPPIARASALASAAAGGALSISGGTSTVSCLPPRSTVASNRCCAATQLRMAARPPLRASSRSPIARPSIATSLSPARSPTTSAVEPGSTRLNTTCRNVREAMREAGGEQAAMGGAPNRGREEGVRGPTAAVCKVVVAP